jgi:transcriptional repressor NrdR
VRRRRECEACGHRFTSFERYAEAVAVVRKRDGRRQPFDVDKVRAGLERAAHKREAAEAAIESITEAVVAETQRSGEISSRRIGELCLGGLRDTDRIAYLRFASVHKQLADLEAISAELSELAFAEEIQAEILRTGGSDSQDLSIQPARREKTHA